MFTSQLAIDLVLVALGTALILLVLCGVRDAVRRLYRREGVATPKRPAISPAVALAGALVALLGVHVMRTGLPSAEASPGPEEVGTAAALGRGRAPGAVAVGPVSARIGTVMGRSTLDLREAIIGPGEEAVVTVFVAVGRVTLRVPDGWELDATALPAISTVEDTREPRPGAGEDAPAEPAPRLVLRGLVMIGTVEVTS